MLWLEQATQISIMNMLHYVYERSFSSNTSLTVLSFHKGQHLIESITAATTWFMYRAQRQMLHQQLVLDLNSDNALRQSAGVLGRSTAYTRHMAPVL